MILFSDENPGRTKTGHVMINSRRTEELKDHVKYTLNKILCVESLSNIQTSFVNVKCIQTCKNIFLVK